MKNSAIRLSLALIVIACVGFGIHLLVLGEDARFYTCIGKSKGDVVQNFGQGSTSWAEFFPDELQYRTGANVVRLSLDSRDRVKWVTITPED
ncbi:MAG: hypothetical protein F9K51_05245 [Candidatus Dadabacteria bacterium]|nr:MAG: hypothetical protein F9K51_05245 [Candidatus Dadabacteria bacterium]